MLSGSALLRVVLLLVGAASLAGLVQHYWAYDGGLPEAPLPEVTAAGGGAARPPETLPAPPPDPAPMATPQPAATADLPAPAPPSPAQSMFATDPAPAPQGQAQEQERRQDTALAARPAPERSPARETASPPARSAAIPPAKTAAVPLTPEPGEAPAPAESAEPRAIDLVDLNSASLTELNGLKGGGAIGRAIIQHRPYASIDQLLSKRVLSRAIYQRVKDQVTVR